MENIANYLDDESPVILPEAAEEKVEGDKAKDDETIAKEMQNASVTEETTTATDGLVPEDYDEDAALAAALAASEQEAKGSATPETQSKRERKGRGKNKRNK